MLKSLKCFSIGLTLGLVVALLWVFSSANYLSMILQLVTPVVIYISIIGFGFFGLLGAFIATAVAYLFSGVNVSSAIFSMVQLFLPAFLVGIIFYIRFVFKNNIYRINQGYALFILALLPILAFIVVAIFFEIQGSSLEALVEDKATSILMSMRGTMPEVIELQNSSFIGLFIQTLPSMIMSMWIFWQFIMMLLASNIVQYAKILPNGYLPWAYKAPKIQWYSFLLSLLVLAISYIYLPNITFFAINVAFVLASLFFYEGLTWVDIQIGNKWLIRIVFWFLLIFWNMPIILFLIVVGIFQQFSIFSSLKIWKKK